MTYYFIIDFGSSRKLIQYHYCRQNLITIHHPRVVVSASYILAEASLQFSCHPSVGMASHLKEQ